MFSNVNIFSVLQITKTLQKLKILKERKIQKRTMENPMNKSKGIENPAQNENPNSCVVNFHLYMNIFKSGRLTWEEFAQILTDLAKNDSKKSEQLNSFILQELKASYDLYNTLKWQKSQVEISLSAAKKINDEKMATMFSMQNEIWQIKREHHNVTKLLENEKSKISKYSIQFKKLEKIAEELTEELIGKINDIDTLKIEKQKSHDMLLECLINVQYSEFAKFKCFKMYFWFHFGNKYLDTFCISQITKWKPGRRQSKVIPENHELLVPRSEDFKH